MDNYSSELLQNQFPNIELNNINRSFGSAAHNGHLVICEWLMQFNPDVHAIDDYAFRWAARNGHLETCMWLIQFKPDVHAVYDYVTRWAAENDHLETCMWLIEIDKDLIELLNEEQLKKLEFYVNMKRKKSARSV